MCFLCGVMDNIHHLAPPRAGHQPPCERQEQVGVVFAMQGISPNSECPSMVFVAVGRGAKSGTV